MRLAALTTCMLSQNIDNGVSLHHGVLHKLPCHCHNAARFHSKPQVMFVCVLLSFIIIISHAYTTLGQYGVAQQR